MGYFPPSDQFITGAATQTASGNNILLTSSGTAAIDVSGFRAIAIQIVPTGTVSSGVVTFEVSNDNTTFVSLPLYDEASLTVNPISTVSPATGVNRYFLGPIHWKYIRARISTVIGGGGSIRAYTTLTQNNYQPDIYTVTQATGANLNVAIASGTVTTVSTVTAVTNVNGGQTAHSAASTGNPLRVGGRVVETTAATQDQTLVAGDAANLPISTGNQAIIKPYSTADVDWHYVAATGGIVTTTTAVTIKAASGTAGIRNYITSIDISAIGAGTATELCIRDGAAGTVIWRIQIPAAGIANPFTIHFPTPLRGTANTLLEVVTLTSSATPVFFNAHGYTNI